MSGRTLGALAYPFFSKNVIDWSYCVRVDFTGGSLHLSDRDGGFTQDIGDGSGSVLWSDARALTVDVVSQGEADPLEIASLEIGNLDNLFTAYALAPAGIRNVPVAIYVVGFDATGAYVDAALIFAGYLDAGDFSDGAVATMTLRPFTSSFTQLTPSVTFTRASWLTILPEGFTLAWGDTVQTAAGASDVQKTTGGTPPPPPPPPPTPGRGKQRITPVTDPSAGVVSHSPGIHNPVAAKNLSR